MVEYRAVQDIRVLGILNAVWEHRTNDDKIKCVTGKIFETNGTLIGQ